MLQSFQDFFPSVSDYFAQPRAVVHIHEECPLADADGLGMCGQCGIDEMVPGLQDL